MTRGADKLKTVVPFALVGSIWRPICAHAVQRGVCGAVALVVDRGAIRRPLGLPADGLHAMLPRL